MSEGERKDDLVCIDGWMKIALFEIGGKRRSTFGGQDKSSPGQPAELI